MNPILFATTIKVNDLHKNKPYPEGDILGFSHLLTLKKLSKTNPNE